jgi:CRISPR/Cas system-associated protein Csm6
MIVWLVVSQPPTSNNNVAARQRRLAQELKRFFKKKKRKEKGKLQDSPYFSSKNQNSRHNSKIIKMVVLMYKIIKTVVSILF